MDLQLRFHTAFSKREQFEVIDGQHAWNIFLLVTEGSFTMTLKDTGQTYLIEKNEIGFFPINIPFSRRVLTPITFHQFAFYADSSHPFYQSLPYGKLTVPHEQVAAVATAIERADLLPDNRAILSHLAEHIMAEQYLYSSAEPNGIRGYSEDVWTVMQYMHDHLSEKLDMDDLAAMVYLSHVGLIWKFRRQLGTTPSRYLIRLRLHYAKQLILEGHLPINEIAARCGYSSPYYFTSAFRQAYGMSPTEFRRRQTEKK